MTSTRYQEKHPEACESPQDSLLPALEPKSSTEAAKTTPSLSSVQHQLMIELNRCREIDLEEVGPRQNPKRVTGIHPDVRATSTDNEQLTMPVPDLDDPEENTPGEVENPQHDFDEEIIEDAYED